MRALRAASGRRRSAPGGTFSESECGRPGAQYRGRWSTHHDGKTDEGGSPGLLQGAVMLKEYEDEYRPARPPYPCRRRLLPCWHPSAGFSDTGPATRATVDRPEVACLAPSRQWASCLRGEKGQERSRDAASSATKPPRAA